jgi:predicted GNAT family N-acyltransferase
MNQSILTPLESINSDIYNADSIQFNLLSLILENACNKLYSDNSHIIICQSNPNKPTWIWTDGTITKDSAAVLYDTIYHEFKINENSIFVVKPALYHIIEKVIKNKTGKESCIVTNMMSYQCVEPLKPEFMDGHMEQANIDDIDTIAEYIANDLKEMNNINTSKEEQLDNSKALIESGNLYVWENSNEAITSLAFIVHRSKAQARINRVYTNPAYRNKGYAAMLMFQLSKLILEEGRIPMVYTDAAYPASNKAYKKVGYTECGGLYEIGVKK